MGNHKIKFAGKAQINDLSLTINDYVGTQVYEALWAWQNKAYNMKTQKIGRAADYKINAYLHQYSPDFEKTIRTWELKGCWITGLTEPDFNDEQDGKIQIKAQISYDIYEVISEAVDE